MEKIEAMIEELAKECNEQDVTLLVSATNQKEIRTVICGSPKSLAVLHSHLEESLNESLESHYKTCDCPNCKAKRAHDDEPRAQKVIIGSDESDIAKILAAILGGKNND